MTAPIKMLVADDSRTIHAFFQKAVGQFKQPVEIVCAYDGRQCAELLDRGNIDLAFIDINMPQMSGMEAVGAARQHRIKTFVTLMSGEVEAPSSKLARELKVYEYLAKPFQAEDIEAIVDTYCRLSAPKRALIVDDVKTMRLIIQKVLANSIFRLELEDAADGETAVARCQAESFDIVFLDCNMPGMNGLETLDRLLASEPRLKVVMMSAEHHAEREHEALKRGATAFLHKPFYPADIDTVLHDIHKVGEPSVLVRLRA